MRLITCYLFLQDPSNDTFNKSKSSIKIHGINVVIPGSYGIPEWVSHKSIGREIRIELPKNCYEDNNFLRFALFFYLLPLDDPDLICKMIYVYQPCITYSYHSHIQFGISDGNQSECMKSIDVESRCKSILNSDVGYENFTTSSLDPALWVVYFPQIPLQ